MMKEVLKEAREYVTKGEYDLALYIVRDLELVETAGLGELVWSYFSYSSCGYIPKGEIEYILDRLEQALVT